ncbi:hypothetical protein FNV43_RR18601 [Rhamnella rubrinervis]|uniref:Uncharacterized protein n=1 Tax=Rhamnella rubrinervis TaxID=2594499 RepID=A0A8K0EB92_9ROSA|nr:hypothetical protein FNV43_RR18601 [Rhamnella rubrinervis]
MVPCFMVSMIYSNGAEMFHIGVALFRYKTSGRNGSDILGNELEIEEKKQAAADVLSQYSKFVMACIGNQVRPCDLRLHLMKEISGLPTSLKKESQTAASPDAMGESSSSGTARLDKADSFRAL